MPPTLLERGHELDSLRAAGMAAQAGRGTIVLVTGEAGVGKTSVIRAGLAAVTPGVRTLWGACDDLLAPRALGPLRDAARGSGGPLERALHDAPDAVFAGVLAELSAAPTVLVIDDVHWADDATIDVLRYLIRRIEDLSATLVLSLRDEEVVDAHPVRQLLGALAGVHPVRLPLLPLSPSAVSSLAESAGRDGATIHAVTGGNPFYVTETLAAPADATPVSVAAAVLARLRHLSPAAVTALEQLCVVPTQVPLPLAEGLLGDRLEMLAEAEERGIIVVTASGLAFRHELARRAIEMSLPVLRTRVLHRAVVVALRAGESPDLHRLVHHAVRGDDIASIVEFAPVAARDASAAGSHHQALAQFEVVVPHAARLAPVEQARLLADYSWELYIAHRFRDAIAAARAAVQLFERQAEPELLGEAMLMLARHLYMSGDSDASEDVGQRAVAVLRGVGSPQALATATTHEGATLVLTGQMAAAIPVLVLAESQSVAAGRSDLQALVLNYLGFATAEQGDRESGEATLRHALDLALALGHHEAAARAYINLGELLFYGGNWDTVAESIAAGLSFVTEHHLRGHTRLLEFQRCILLIHVGDWDAADHALQVLAERTVEASVQDAHMLSIWGRLLARRGRPDAGEMLERAWNLSCTLRAPLNIARAGVALVEWSWLTGAPQRAQQISDVLLAHMRAPGWTYPRAELVRFLVRAGVEIEPFEGCPEAFAAGIRGDWRAAAASWGRSGDPYLRALELGDSGEVEPMLEAVRVLDGLGAVPAATLVRRKLREHGVNRVPRSPRPATIANPAGLTDRQMDVADLLVEGATNAEIAARLVLSVRTVDHHVSAVLAKLGVNSRRAAAAALRSLHPTP